MWTIWIDRGGTFTDIIALSPGGKYDVVKVLTAKTSLFVAIRELLNLKPDQTCPLLTVHLGSTIATNALLEKKGVPFALFITKGFGDLLTIGNQQRPNIFDYFIKKQHPLPSLVVEFNARLDTNGTVVRSMDDSAIIDQLKSVYNQGIRSLAVVDCHSYINKDHEERICRLAQDIGFDFVTGSADLMPEMGLLARTETTCLDAYLTPLIQDYFHDMSPDIDQTGCKVMMSNGGLVDYRQARGPDLVLSGPAGGVLGMATLSSALNRTHLIGFDMGGTSTDVARFTDRPDWCASLSVGGYRVKRPIIDIHTIAAGGGSICRVSSGRLVVGPDSAGASPGPLCYGHQNDQGEWLAHELTVTDLNLFLGRVVPDNFPLSLSVERVKPHLSLLMSATSYDNRQLEQLAQGFLDVANTHMAQAVRTLVTAKGADPRDYALCCYGGAGGQHIAAIARELGIDTIICHPLAGVFSAFGIGHAPLTWQQSCPVGNYHLSDDWRQGLSLELSQLKQAGDEYVRQHDWQRYDLDFEYQFECRYQNMGDVLVVSDREGDDLRATFELLFKQQSGYVLPDTPIEVVQCRLWIRVSVEGSRFEYQVDHETDTRPVRYQSMYLNGEWQNVPVFWRRSLASQVNFAGPAMILDDITTLIVEPDFDFIVDQQGILTMTRQVSTKQMVDSSYDSALLEVFNHRFMAIASQMGDQLQRTARSVNVKERLDFSCALFDDKGYLVANAPHIPVHLGAMGTCVRAVIDKIKTFEKGTSYLTNHPYQGGSHLPDLTVVSPVFLKYQSTPSFFVASRAHHADIGGPTPGSMPAFSTTLKEEGIVIPITTIATKYQLLESVFKDIFLSVEYPVRYPADNRYDLLAQLAANRYGEQLLDQLVSDYSLSVVLAYMGYIRDHSAGYVKDLFKQVDGKPRRFKDTLDDGSVIAVTLSVVEQRLRIDFSHSAGPSKTNFNCPLAVVRSAVLYVLRLQLGPYVPLNDGCLDNVDIIVKPSSLLSPPNDVAVVAGNVETSQRIVDVLLGCFGLAAASQGTMNNITFGNHSFGYYETIGGGVGGSHLGPGASSVHSHMTNTCITDPEILERYYPIRLVSFNVRQGSGGDGYFPGGHGIIRHYQFLEHLSISLITQRRVTAPFGLNGGGAGKSGSNRLITSDGVIDLGFIDQRSVNEGDELIIETPGGGGFGE
ncbi:5-oxoprolinase [Candidatus Marinamargulisbacteria bacterium SCGC AG-410-N11]|nr:5-oxoprolinase [Candidatus Marinamargulisbacteria bacterium SCGC AG-410-N11]